MEVAATARHEPVPQLRFPPGYRFVPTEEELVDVYLRAKIEGHKLPLNVINDVSILDWQPGSLVEAYKGYGENRWFFFTVREQSSSNKEKEPSRKVRGVPGVTATWKATGSVQLIWRATSNAVVGSKRVLIYNSSDPNENGKWSMHEYILKDHAEIGQYALYSIQRKQHSDTEDKAGDGDGDGDDMGSEKKRKRKEKPCTDPEGVQLPHPETTTLLAEPPLKPTTRKAKAQRKKKPSIQVRVEGEQQQQQQQGQSPMEPVTPPKKDELALPQEARQQQAAAVAEGAPAPVVLSAVPLQAVRVCPPSELDGTLAASAPSHEENTLDEMSQFLALGALLYPDMFCNNQGRQEQFPPSLTSTTTFVAAPDTNVVVDHAQFQPYQQVEDSYSLLAVHNQHLLLGENNNQSVYMEQGWQHDDYFLMDNTTQPMNMNSSGSWDSKHGDDQHHHQVHHQQQEKENNGGAFGVVQDQQPMNHPQGGHDLLPVDEQTSSGSDDLQVDSMKLGESVQMDELDAFVRGVLVHRDEPHQDLMAAGTQEQEGGDDPASLQAGMQEQGADDRAALQSLQHDDLQLQWFYYWQAQRARNEHVWDGPCSCMVCAPGP